MQTLYILGKRHDLNCPGSVRLILWVVC